MIEIFESLDIFDLLFDYAQKNNCALIYFVNENYKNCSPEKQQEILSFYEQFLPEDIFETLKQGKYNIIKFDNFESAVVNASSWFPPKVYLPDEDYFWRCYGINSEGDIDYENLDPISQSEEPAEGA